jgi:hypothetical protein
MKLEDVRIKWTSGAGCPEGFSLENIYHLVFKTNKIYVSDGNFEVQIEKDALMDIFTPTNAKWEDVEFPEIKPKK